MYFDVRVLDSEIQGELTGVRARLGNLSPAFALIVKDFRRMMVKQFDTEGRHLNGRVWAKLSEAWVASKAAAGTDPRRGHMLRKLRDSFTRGRGGLREQTSDTLTLGTDVEYARIFHEGRGSKQAARPLFTLRVRDQARWTRSIEDFAVNGTRRMGR